MFVCVCNVLSVISTRVQCHNWRTTEVLSDVASLSNIRGVMEEYAPGMASIPSMKSELQAVRFGGQRISSATLCGDSRCLGEDGHVIIVAPVLYELVMNADGNDPDEVTRPLGQAVKGGKSIGTAVYPSSSFSKSLSSSVIKSNIVPARRDSPLNPLSSSGSDSGAVSS